jgi:hypothetical protein
MPPTVTFTKETTTVTLPAPEPGRTLRRARRQAAAESADGTAWVYDQGARADVRTERFASLTDAQADALADFFDTVGGMRWTFTYTDSAGAARTVRFAEPALDFRAAGPDCVDVEVPLREEASA